MKISTILTDPRERERFIKFSIVGAIGFLVDISSFHLLVSILGLTPIVAQGGSFTLAVTSNFTWNRIWTYPDSRSKRVSNQLVTFFLVNIIGLGIRTLIFAGLEGLWRSLFARLAFLPVGLITADRLAYTITLGIAVVVVMFWNYFINRVWTFNDVD